MWKWLNGKKRTIALTYWTVVIPSIAVLWPQGAPDNIDKGAGLLGVLLSALGLGHAAIKSYKIKKSNKK